MFDSNKSLFLFENYFAFMEMSSATLKKNIVEVYTFF